MRKIITLCMLLAYTTSFSFSQDWELVWSDEFNYTGAPDATKWSYDTQGNNWDWGNNEAQNYTPSTEDNAWVDGDFLIIEAQKEQYTWSGDNETKEYTSARLRTINKGDWLYGKIEVKALLPTGNGLWPAIWMMPTDNYYGGWPNSGELDIMENVGMTPNVLHCNIHTESYNHAIGTNKGASKTITSPSENWHVYSLEWFEDNVSFYVDGEFVFSFANEGTGSAEWPFDKRFHLILNVAVGGSWAGQQGIDDAVFPQQMKVDYVRVYKDITSTSLFSVPFNSQVEKIHVYNPLGMLMGVCDEVSISTLTQNLPAGVYLLQYYTTEGIETKKIIVD